MARRSGVEEDVVIPLAEALAAEQVAEGVEGGDFDGAGPGELLFQSGKLRRLEIGAMGGR